MKNRKRILSLALALVMALALLPTVALADFSEPLGGGLFTTNNTTGVDVSVPAQVKENGQPEQEKDAIHITHVVAQEEVTCDGETIPLYTIYPGAHVWRFAHWCEYMRLHSYTATMENRTLYKEEEVETYEPEYVPGNQW